MEHDTSKQNTPTSEQTEEEARQRAKAAAEMSDRDLPGWWAEVPHEIASMLMLIRPPMSAGEEIEAARKLTKSMIAARRQIPSIPKDQNVNYESTRSTETVDYNFASLDSIHSQITEPLCDNGLWVTCLTSPYAVVVVLLHEDGGMLPSWLDLAESDDIKDTAKQITMLRRYLTVQLLCLAAEEESGERDIKRNARQGTGKRADPQNAAPRATARAGAAAARPGAGQQRQPDNRPATTSGERDGNPGSGPRPGRATRPAAAGSGTRPAQASGTRGASPSTAQHTPGARPVRAQGAAGATETARHEEQNQIDATLAQLPAEKAQELRETYKGKASELLKAAQAAAGGDTKTGHRATTSHETAISETLAALKENKAAEMALRSEFIGDPTGLLKKLQSMVDSSIGRGLSALKMTPAEETALRSEYMHQPNSLLCRIREMYTAKRSAS